MVELVYPTLGPDNERVKASIICRNALNCCDNRWITEFVHQSNCDDNE